MESLPHDPENGKSGFQRELPDNSVEYFLFVIDPQSDTRATYSQLEALRKEAVALCRGVAKDYIWQRDEFNLDLKNEDGLVYLHGQTEYGDAVEDEWLIVYLLRELTVSHPRLWVRVLDTDGEFLLVEAANVLPKWLSPEIDHNRVWVHDGKLWIIPLKDGTGSESRNISMKDSVAFLRSYPDSLVYSSFVEAEAFYRLEKYPEQITDAIHYTLVTIPRRLAYILHHLPKSVAPAVEAFYLRDALTLKPILSSASELVFPPEDLVTVSVRFSKVLFAQLRSQRFEAPQRWEKAFAKVPCETKAEVSNDATTARLEAGMKLTCGFEILIANAERSKSRVVRELAITAEDLMEDGDEVLPSDAEIQSWPHVERNDGEAWMDINYEDFERELEGKRSNDIEHGMKSFGDSNAQDNLRKIVSRFEAFLNDDAAGLDGADLDAMDFDNDDDGIYDEEEVSEDSDAEDKEVSFDEEEFAKMMREMMGLPSPSKVEPGASHANAKGKSKKHFAEDLSISSDGEDEEIRQLASQFEAELNQHGALKLDPATKKKAMLKEKDGYGGPSQKLSGTGEEDSDEDTDGQVDVDYNLAKNILESFKSQGGMAGPTGNLLGMMGLNLPRDEDDGTEDQDMLSSRRK